MSTLYSSPPSGRQVMPVQPFRYRERGSLSLPQLPQIRNAAPTEPGVTPEAQLSEEILREKLAAVHADATAAAEARLRAEYETRAAQERAQIVAAVEAFGREAKAYYSRVEGEVVRLALSIAAKILHRESQVDPMLVAALVQIAVNQLKENSAVTIRVRPEAESRWRAEFESTQQWAKVSITGDATLEPGGCVLETQLGTANLSLEAQLKEVEQGFFDMLAQKPRS